jgi:hypothetical protein
VRENRACAAKIARIPGQTAPIVWRRATPTRQPAHPDRPRAGYKRRALRPGRLPCSRIRQRLEDFGCHLDDNSLCCGPPTRTSRTLQPAATKIATKL